MKLISNLFTLFLFSIATTQAQIAPKITVQPISQAANPGSNVTLKATANGTSPMSYQWFFQNLKTPIATNATLSLTNIQWTQAGDYFLTISNTVGSTTSQVAKLTLVNGFSRYTNAALRAVKNPLGGAWGDWNKDGWLDLFVTGESYAMFTNNGSGGLETVVGSVLDGHASGGRLSPAWGDVDNDGDLDLIICGAPGKGIFLYKNQGNGNFVQSSEPHFAPRNVQCVTSSFVDYDQDGFLDLFIPTTSLSFTGANDLLFRNDGTGSFLPITNSIVSTSKTVAQSGIWGDIDNDGDLDLFVANLTGLKNRLYRNDSRGQFVFLATNTLVTTSQGQSGGAAWGDYDNDGDLDLFVSNFSGLNAYLYKNDGAGNFTRITTGIVVKDGTSAGCAWLDFDNDGWLDLISAGTKNLLYHNDGDGNFTKVTTGNLVTQTVSGWGNNSFNTGDMNRDGFTDLFFSNYGGASELFLNAGNSNSWLVVRCEGRVSNRSAIGSKVRIGAMIAGKFIWQMREISGGGVVFGQNAPQAEFGLGNALLIDDLRIEWPSGIVQEFKNIQPNQTISIVEPSRLALEKVDPLNIAIEKKSWGGVAQLEISSDLLTWQISTNDNSPTNRLFLPIQKNQPGEFFRSRETAR